MNEKLTPLEAWERIKKAETIYVGCVSDIHTKYPKETDIIETALKELEGIKNGSIRLSVNSGENYVAMPKYQYEQDLKKLKALEIIKDKGVNVYYLKYTEDAYDYNRCIRGNLQACFRLKELNQEEFNLLREALL